MNDKLLDAIIGEAPEEIKKDLEALLKNRRTISFAEYLGSKDNGVNEQFVKDYIMPLSKIIPESANAAKLSAMICAIILPYGKTDKEAAELLENIAGILGHAARLENNNEHGNLGLCSIAHVGVSDPEKEEPTNIEVHGEPNPASKWAGTTEDSASA